MLFKKNKPNSPPVDPGNALPSLGGAAMGSSLFAPGLNPHTMPIDFGFDRIPSAPAPSYVVPAPPSDSSLSDSLSCPQPDEPNWQAETVSPEPVMYGQSPMPELLNDAAFADLLTAPLMPATALPSSIEADPAYLGETFENYSAPPASFGEDPATPWEQPVVEAGVPDWNRGMPLASDMAFEAFGIDSPEAQTSFSESSGLESLTDSSDLSADWASLSGSSMAPGHASSIMGDLMPWEQSPSGLDASSSPSAEALWEQLGPGGALPGEQVPMAPGAFMDSMHQQLYPEDPLSTGYDALAEGQQAFEDAAQFLFPDTMSAPLDWQADSLSPEGLESFGVSGGLPHVEDYSPQPIDLGPSVQSTVSEVNDITAYYPIELQSSLYQEMPTSLPELPEPMLEPVSDSFDPFALEAVIPDFSVPDPSQGIFEAQSVSLDAQYSQAESWATEAWDTPSASPDALEFVSNAYEDIPDQPVAASFLEEVFEDDAASLALEPKAVEFSSDTDFGESSLGAASLDTAAFEVSALSDQDFYATDFTLNELGELVPVAEQSDSVSPSSFATPAPEIHIERPTDVSAFILDDALLAPPSDEVFELSGPQATATPLSSAFQPALEPDVEPSAGQTLWDQWSGSPSLEELPIEPQIEARMEFQSSSLEDFSVEASSDFLGVESGLSPVEQQVTASDDLVFEPEAPVGPVALNTAGSEQSVTPVLPDTSGSPFGQISMPNLPTPTGSLPLASASDPFLSQSDEDLSAPLEAEWQQASSEIVVSAVQSSVAQPPAEFSLSDIEVLGVCPLFGERRLLLVSSNGIFALMGQVGLQQPQIAVLKLFEHNPLAYQNTFTAVAEAQAEAQGMFVAQLGTWRGIISTFQDKITLHTDLG